MCTGSYDLSEDRLHWQGFASFSYKTNRLHVSTSLFSCIIFVDHARCLNVVGKLVTDLAASPHVLLFVLWHHLWFVLRRCTATCNLFVEYTAIIAACILFMPSIFTGCSFYLIIVLLVVKQKKEKQKNPYMWVIE